MRAMKQASEAHFGAGYSVLPVWKERLSAKTLVTTPNSDVIYAMGYVDLGKDGPLVIELPPNQQGILDDFWQRPVSGPTVDDHDFAGDVGLAGSDRGKGCKYLLLPQVQRHFVAQLHMIEADPTDTARADERRREGQLISPLPLPAVVRKA
jgi:hypothetical protein